MERITLRKGPLIVLGKGLSGDPKKGQPVTVSIHSKLNVIAAAILYKQWMISAIIFTGGHTLGKEYISEADAMKEYLHKVFPTIPRDKVLVESNSIDTLGNITELLERGFIKKHTTVNVLSLDQHLRRSKKLFWNIAQIDAQTISAQDVIEKYGTAIQKIPLENFTNSSASTWETFKETILNIEILFDPQGKLLRKITALLRHGD